MNLIRFLLAILWGLKNIRIYGEFLITQEQQLSTEFNIARSKVDIFEIPFNIGRSWQPITPLAKALSTIPIIKLKNVCRITIVPAARVTEQIKRLGLNSLTSSLPGNAHAVHSA